MDLLEAKNISNVLRESNGKRPAARMGDVRSKGCFYQGEDESYLSTYEKKGRF